MKIFSDKDIQQIQNKNIPIESVYEQVARLKEGMSFSELVAAATLGKGIECYDAKEEQRLINLYEAKRNTLSIVKFVPASGAATRMFKFLFKFLKNFKASKEDLKEYADRENDILIEDFVKHLEKFPFYNEVVSKIKKVNPDYNTLSKDEQCLQCIKTMLDCNGLNYSILPKGLLPFHVYDDEVKTAFEEHLFESTLYASSNGVSNIHFTVSKNHHLYFKNELNRLKKALEKARKTQFNVTFSFQKEATQTIALTAKGDIFRNYNQSMFFRPAGHGALLENLNDLNNDLIFIKNIDNIVVAEKNIKVSRYKKLLAGVLLEAQEKVFSYLKKLDEGHLETSDFKPMVLFLRNRLNVSVVGFETFSFKEKVSYLIEKFNRPIRVCGMVKNEGEPGGGPFWVKNKEGDVSLQIVEFAQINFGRKNQQSIVYKATHFNPTDLVCGVKNYKGEKFDLTTFVDPETAFITTKTKDGVDIQALELPGLWNGSMAYWNSIFVEVPLETFNPVKTVNDLLNLVHQAS